MRENSLDPERRPNGGLFARPKGRTVRDQTAWLGREDSNLRMAESKSAALPLGYAPKPSDGRARRLAPVYAPAAARTITMRLRRINGGSGAAFMTLPIL